MEMTKEQALSLLQWIKEDAEKLFTVEEFSEGTTKGILLKSESTESYIRIYFLQFIIMEYRIGTGDEEPLFYLHFELNDEDHAKQLYEEMKECIIKHDNGSTTHVLLCCSCGLTTSFFAMKLNEAAKNLGMDMDFEAVPYEQMYEKSRDKDIVLLAPQIGYQLKNAQKILNDKIVITVPTAIFSGYKVFDLLTLVNETLKDNVKETNKQTHSGVAKLNEAEGTVLVVTVINMEGRNQIAYRVYDNGKMTASNQVVKPTYQFSDVMDTIRVAVNMTSGIEEICLVTPGSISEGKLTYESANIFDLDAAGEIEKETGLKTHLLNDADMIALGYYMIEKPEKDIAFYFLPTGTCGGSVGIVANGSIIRSARHMGGRQLDAVTSITTFPKNPYTLTSTPEGCVQLASRYITGLISYTGIDHIAFYGKMIPDAQVLTEAVKDLIPDDYTPEIVKCESIREYLYKGALETLENS